jgi:uncharacterized protein (TIGR03790 family)
MRRAILALLTLLSAAVRGAIDPATVVVVGSARDAGSAALAREYARARGLPASNLILLDLPPSAAASVSWADYARLILNPLRAELARRGLVSGKAGGPLDTRGRSGFVADGPPKAGWIVLCHGLPWLIRRDPGPDGKTPGPSPRSEAASVDSELALLALPDTDPAGHRPNPWFGNPDGGEATRLLIRTARLDGPSVAAVRRALAGARLAEERGLRGRAYVDRGGPYKEGDLWLERAEQQCRALGFPTTVDTARTPLGGEARFDAPALYFGWYEASPKGRVAEPQVRLAPGAVAFHLHSFSAVALRDGKRGWTGSLVEKGAGLTFGNVAEPYLTLSIRPDLVLAGLAQGMTAGEAAWVATPATSWMGVIVGDPMYRPFATPLSTQLDPRQQPADPWTAYGYLRAASLERVEPELREALLGAGLQRSPSLAGLLEYARQRQAGGKSFNWPNRALPRLAEEDAGLVLEAARFLRDAGRRTEAGELYGLLRGRVEADPVRLRELSEDEAR